MSRGHVFHLVHCFIFFSISHSRAETLESRYLRSISAARSVAEVEELKQNYEQLSVARTACLIQLRERSVPTACYEELSLAIKDGEQDSALQIKKLDKLCMSASLRLRLNSVPGPYVSRYCVNKVHEAMVVQAYRQEDVWPGD
jgi:hypothetical protein